MNRALSHLSRAAFALLAVAAAASSQAAICNNVVFSFTNISSGPILVSRVDYRDLNSSDPNRRWVENVSDFSCPTLQTCFTTPQDLGGTTRPRENHDLTSIRFEHAHQDEFGNWRDPVWSSSNTPVDMTCTDGRTYGAYNVN
jgi:hypothetical protein